MTKAGVVFRSSTFRPFLDQAMAREGVGVVLWADAQEALVLRFESDCWLITRHPALAADFDGSTRRLHWRGVQYAVAGERMIELSDAAGAAEWDAAYERLFDVQNDRLRNHLNEFRAHDRAACA